MSLRSRLAAVLATLDIEGMKVLIVEEAVERALFAVEKMKVISEEVYQFAESPDEIERHWEEPEAIQGDAFSNWWPSRPEQLPSSYG